MGFYGYEKVENNCPKDVDFDIWDKCSGCVRENINQNQMRAEPMEMIRLRAKEIC